MDRLKRELREQKRQVKKRGNKHRRQVLDRALRENPEEAHLAVPSFGRHRSADLNGNDRDATRKRFAQADTPDEQEPPDHETSI